MRVRAFEVTMNLRQEGTEGENRASIPRERVDAIMPESASNTGVRSLTRIILDLAVRPG
jgi:hypothetical protein